MLHRTSVTETFTKPMTGAPHPATHSRPRIAANPCATASSQRARRNFHRMRHSIQILYRTRQDRIAHKRKISYSLFIRYTEKWFPEFFSHPEKYGWRYGSHPKRAVPPAPLTFACIRPILEAARGRNTGLVGVLSQVNSIRLSVETFK